MVSNHPPPFSFSNLMRQAVRCFFPSRVEQGPIGLSNTRILDKGLLVKKRSSDDSGGGAAANPLYAPGRRTLSNEVGIGSERYVLCFPSPLYTRIL